MKIVAFEEYMREARLIERFPHHTTLRMQTRDRDDLVKACRDWLSENVSKTVNLRFIEFKEIEPPDWKQIRDAAMRPGPLSPDTRRRALEILGRFETEATVACDDLAALTALKLMFS